MPRNTAASAQRKTPRNQWVTVQQVAEMLSVHPRTVRRWIESGDLPAYRFGPTVVRIRAEDIDQMAGYPIPSALDR